MRAAECLYEWHEAAAPAAQALVDALSDRHMKVRQEAVETLVSIGPKAFPPLLKLVEGRDIDMRLLALEVCGKIGGVHRLHNEDRKDISPLLMKCLSDKDPAIRCASVECLAWIRDFSSVPRLIKVLEDDKDPDVRREVMVTFTSFGKRAEAAVPLLAKIMVEEHGKKYKNLPGETVGWNASLALSSIGEPAVLVLASTAANGKLPRDLRDNALSALRQMAGRAKFAAAAPAICKLLSDRDEKLRWHAAFTLGKMESADAKTRAALIAATKDRSPRVRIEAAEAIYRFDPKNPIVMATILPALDDRDAGVRTCACFTLKSIGAPEAVPAIPQLTALVSDANVSVRLYAIYALSTMAGQKANIASAVSALNLATKDKNPDVRREAEECLKSVKR